MGIFGPISERLHSIHKRGSKRYPENIHRSIETFSKHEDENLPEYQNVELAIVVPTHRELSNGNLPFMLQALSEPTVPKDDVVVVFVVNNPRFYEAMYSSRKLISSKQYSSLPHAIRSYYADQGWSMEQSEIEELSSLDWKVQNINYAIINQWKRMISTFKENRATLQLLQILTETTESPMDSVAKEQAMQKLENIWEMYSPGASLRVVLLPHLSAV